MNAAHQEAFADHREYTPRDFESWSKFHLGSERFDPTLWCVVRAGDEIAAETICTGDTYGGGFVHALFTRRPWRKQGVGAALLRDSLLSPGCERLRNRSPRRPRRTRRSRPRRCRTRAVASSQ